MTYDGRNSYLYDAEGRVCAVAETVNGTTAINGYAYDASGTRVARGSLSTFNCNFASNGFATTASWVLGPGGEQVTEYSVSSGTSTFAHNNVFAAGSLLATYTGTSTYFAFHDWLGSKRVEIAANSTCASAFVSLPFGNTSNGNSSYSPIALSGYSACADATEHHFTNKERDAESGNDYFEARYYSSAMGRFMSPDWSAKEEPVPYAKQDNPQSLNLYAYVLNNPLSRADKDGHCAEDACVAETAVGVGILHTERSRGCMLTTERLRGSARSTHFHPPQALQYRARFQISRVFSANRAAPAQSLRRLQHLRQLLAQQIQIRIRSLGLWAVR